MIPSMTAGPDGTKLSLVYTKSLLKTNEQSHSSRQLTEWLHKGLKDVMNKFKESSDVDRNNDMLSLIRIMSSLLHFTWQHSSP